MTQSDRWPQIDQAAQVAATGAYRGNIPAAGSARSVQQTLAAMPGDMRRYWWVVLLALTATLGATAFFASRQVAIFQSHTTLVVIPNVAITEPRAISDSLDTLDRRTIIATIAQLPASRTVQRAAQQQLQIADRQFARISIYTAVVPDSNVIEVTVAGPDPRQAANLANAVADISVAKTGDLFGIFQMKVLDRAEPAATANGTTTSRKLFGGALFGLLAGVAAALLLGYFRRALTGRAWADNARAETGDSGAAAALGQPAASTSTKILQIKAYGKPRTTTLSSEDD